MFSEDSYPHSCIEEELKTRLKIAQDSAYDNYENAVQKGRNVVDDIKKDTNMYKNNTKMRRVFTQLHSYKNDIQKQINNLEKLKDNIREEYKDYLSVVVKAIVENAQDSLMKSISNRTEDRDQADNHIQDAKNEFKRQAQEDLKKDRNEAEEATEPKYAELHKQMIEVAFNEDLNKKLKKVEKRILAASDQIKANIEKYKSWKKMYEDWQREFAINTSAEVKQLNDYLDQEKARQKNLSRSYGLTRYMRQEANRVCFLNCVNSKRAPC